MKFKKLLIALISLIGFLFFLSPTINGHVDMEHYQRVCKKPLTETPNVLIEKGSANSFLKSSNAVFE